MSVCLQSPWTLARVVDDSKPEEPLFWTRCLSRMKKIFWPSSRRSECDVTRYSLVECLEFVSKETTKRHTEVTLRRAKWKKKRNYFVILRINKFFRQTSPRSDCRSRRSDKHDNESLVLRWTERRNRYQEEGKVVI